MLADRGGWATFIGTSKGRNEFAKGQPLHLPLADRDDFYIANWPQLRTIEGASQRVQEDTMRFATTMEGLGVNLISAVLTLLAFLRFRSGAPR